MGGALLFASLVAASSPLWGELDPGPYPVGFERVEVFDYSRPYRLGVPDRARLLTLFVWYPAEPAGGLDERQRAAVAFERYVRGGGSEAGREEFERRLAQYGFSLSGKELDMLLATPTAAFEGAPHASGPFPLLVFGGSLTGPAYLNTVLSEYLASHGYVSVAIPSLPAREDVEADFDGIAVDTQLRDMELAIQTMHDYPETSLDGIGLVGWSFSGIAQALLSMKNSDVAAVVSLDAAAGYAYGQSLLESSLHYVPGRATAAYFHASDSRESGRVPKSFAYYDEVVRGRAFLLTISGATHAEFTSLAVAPLAVVARAGAADALRRYGLLCLYVRRFLDLVLEDDPEAREFLEVAPTRHGFEGLVLSRK